MGSMNNIFNQILVAKPKRAKFDLSHERKMTIPFGALIPTYVQEILPGDSMRFDQQLLARFQAMLAPPMHKVNVWTHVFFVPYRILNVDFTRFITYQGNRPNFSQAASVAPYFLYSDARTATIYGAAGTALKDGSLLDYLGFPTAPNDVTLNVPSTFLEQTRFSAFLPLAYQRIWSDWYRDPNFTQPLFNDDGTSNFAGTSSKFFDNTTMFDNTLIPDPETTNTSDATRKVVELLKLRWRCWEKDYLTSAAPYANQGIGDPRVPITVPAGALGNAPAAGNPIPVNPSTFGKTGGIAYPGSAGNPTDLGGFTVSALRVAAALKRWLENTARGGTRYVESLWLHWMVKSSDARIQSAEYLGGGVQPMVISEVVTQAPATTTQTGVPPGYLAGHGISYGQNTHASKRFEEHGVVMAITSVLPRTSYLYSMPRAFMRSEPLDFAFPEFAQIGEQPLLGSEVMFKLDTTASASAPNYVAGSVAQTYYGIVSRYAMGYTGAAYYGFDLQNDNPESSVTGTAWGFQSRYAEYKYMPDTVHGLMRNNQSFWHFGRMLQGSAPALNNAFVQSNPRMDPFAVLPSNGGAAGQYNQHPIFLQVHNRVSMVRSLPYFNTPSLW